MKSCVACVCCFDFLSFSMFSTFDRLKKRTPKDGINRLEYISLLTDEFYETTNIEAQEQVTANLANFAYDPINYQFLKECNVCDLFLELLTSKNQRLILHGIAGICNLCLDNEFRAKLIKEDCINLISNLLKIDNIDIRINTLTTLIFLYSIEVKKLICSEANITITKTLTNHKNIQIKNLANLFIKDYCSIKD